MYPLWIIVGIIILTYVIYRIVKRYLLPVPIHAGEEQIDLSKVSQVISSEELKAAWSNTQGSTLIFFVFPEIKDRTSVSGNDYANIIQIGTKQTFKILVSPDAGRGYGMSPAMLEVFVKGSTVPELIEIPNVQLQRWTSVVIVKNGRKFDIYINGALRASHMCLAMPDFDATQPLRIGDIRLSGKVALVRLESYPMKANDVRLLITNLASTDGTPYLSSGVSFPVPHIDDITKLLQCPGGNCATPIQTGPMEEWSSPYA